MNEAVAASLSLLLCILLISPIFVIHFIPPPLPRVECATVRSPGGSLQTWLSITGCGISGWKREKYTRSHCHLFRLSVDAIVAIAVALVAMPQMHKGVDPSSVCCSTGAPAMQHASAAGGVLEATRVVSTRAHPHLLDVQPSLSLQCNPSDSIQMRIYNQFITIPLSTSLFPSLNTSSLDSTRYLQLFVLSTICLFPSRIAR